MKEKIINLIAKLSGLGKAWEWASGKKSYLVAAVGVLSGLAGLGADLLPLVSAQDTGALVKWITGLPSNPSWLLIIGSSGIGALRHAQAKNDSEKPAS